MLGDFRALPQILPRPEILSPRIVRGREQEGQPDEHRQAERQPPPKLRIRRPGQSDRSQPQRFDARGQPEQPHRRVPVLPAQTPGREQQSGPEFGVGLAALKRWQTQRQREEAEQEKGLPAIGPGFFTAE